MIEKFFWNPLIRIILFWVLVAGTVWWAASHWEILSVEVIGSVLRDASNGDLTGLSQPNFAYALATGLGVLAAALALAFGLLHAAAIVASLYILRRAIEAAADMVAFAQSYASIHQILHLHPLIGHAWKEFDETLVMPEDDNRPIRNTVRPQSFINVTVVRDRLFGMKMMGSIPGYFVGIGLLLTFIGLVLALHNAAAAVNSSNTEGMQAATRELLQVATFKFSTSIAGLGASIALSLLFRIYQIMIEGSLDRFCHAVERKLRYTSPQSITAEMNERMAEQVSELKQINSADFFSRMGEQIAPQIHSALTTAMAPMNSSISNAVEKLSTTSQSGVSDLVSQFTTSIQGSAGTEMRELAATLEAIRTSLVDTQASIRGTGVDFGNRMSEAADNLMRLVSEAGERLSETSEKSKDTMSAIVDALRISFDETDKKLQGGLNQATEAAARALNDSLGGALQRINTEFESFSAAMRDAALSLAAQASSLRDTTGHSQAVAEAFTMTAESVRASATPLLQSSNRIATATEQLADTIGLSVTALKDSQLSSQRLAIALQEQVTQLTATWQNYSERFANVDQDLAKAFEALSDATKRQGELLVEYATKVDDGFATAVQRLNPLLSGLEEGAAEFGESVDRLQQTLRPIAAQ